MKATYTCEEHDSAVVVYKEATDCPLCASQSRVTELEGEVADLEKKASQLADESNDYEKQAGELAREILQLQRELSER
jgi:hypothetical protein